jgi:hypothetical protein
MKVHILGKGMISLLGLNAPVRNIDLPETKIRALVPITTLKVYDAESNIIITRNNVDSFFELKNAPVEEAPAPKKETKKPAKKAEPVVVEQVAEPLPVVEEPVEAPAVEEPKEEIPVEVNEEAELTSDEEVYEEAEEEPVSESGDEVEPASETEFVPKKKNKKRR